MLRHRLAGGEQRGCPIPGRGTRLHLTVGTTRTAGPVLTDRQPALAGHRAHAEERDRAAGPAGARAAPATAEQPPDGVGPTLADAVARMGGRDVRIVLQDYGQRNPVPLAGDGLEDGDPVPIDGSATGRCFLTSRAVEMPLADGVRVHAPLLDGGDQAAVLAVTLDAGDDDGRRLLRRLAALAAATLQTKNGYTGLRAKWSLSPRVMRTLPGVRVQADARDGTGGRGEHLDQVGQFGRDVPGTGPRRTDENTFEAPRGLPPEQPPCRGLTAQWISSGRSFGGKELPDSPMVVSPVRAWLPAPHGRRDTAVVSRYARARGHARDRRPGGRSRPGRTAGRRPLVRPRRGVG